MMEAPDAKRFRSEAEENGSNSSSSEPSSTASGHGDDDRKLSYDDLQEIATFVQSQTTIRPKIGIICGSGLGGLADDLDGDQSRDVIPYSKIPKFPTCQVKGHKGNMVFGYISGQPTVCMQGRFHFYEGHPPWKISMPVRILKLLGVETLIVTNASGGLNSKYKVGDIMVISDHINMVGMSGFHPLVGPNEDKFGPRFPAMTVAYDKELRKITKETAKELDMSSFIQEGVYVHISGPTYETPAESRLLVMLGADTVGMSTVPEVVMARHCDMKVLGLSLVTNMVIQDHESAQEPPSHQEVMETSAMRAKDMQKLVKTIVGKLSQ